MALRMTRKTLFIIAFFIVAQAAVLVFAKMHHYSIRQHMSAFVMSKLDH